MLVAASRQHILESGTEAIGFALREAQWRHQAQSRRRDRVDEDAARLAAPPTTSAAGASASSIPEQEPRPAHVIHAGRARRCGARCARRPCGRSPRGPRARSLSSTASAAAAIGGEPPNVVAWSPRSKPPSGASEASSAPIGQAAGEALGDGGRIGPDAGELCAEPGAAASDARLHLVVQQQGAVAVAELARQLEPRGIDRPDAALALDRLDQYRAGSGSDGRRECCQIVARHVAEARGHRLERLALGGRPARPPASRACARGRRPRRTRSRAWPARRARDPCAARA